jgi:hypothetical protein
MLSLGLSVNSGIRLLERTLRFRLISFNRTFQGAGYGLKPAAINSATATSVATAISTKAATIEVEPKNTGLKISKTTMPDRRLDFNQTFQHIRQELDGYYKERNPIFSNTITSDRSLN